MLVLSCVLCLLAAGRFAWTGGSRALRLALSLGASNLFATLAAVSLGLVSVGRHAWSSIETAATPGFASKLITAASESIAAGALGFATLSLAAILLTIGIFRRVPLG